MGIPAECLVVNAMSVARTTVTVCLLVIIKLAGHERRVMMETAGPHGCDDTWKISAQIYSLCVRGTHYQALDWTHMYLIPKMLNV